MVSLVLVQVGSFDKTANIVEGLKRLLCWGAQGHAPSEILKFETLLDMLSCLVKSIVRLLCCT